MGVAEKFGETQMDAALKRFSARVGVAPEGVMAVMVGLAEDERRNRFGAATMAATLLECRGAVGNDVALMDRIDAALIQFETMSVA